MITLPRRVVVPTLVEDFDQTIDLTLTSEEEGSDDEQGEESDAEQMVQSRLDVLADVATQCYEMDWDPATETVVKYCQECSGCKIRVIDVCVCEYEGEVSESE
jgi:hypothetical protein